MQVEGLYQNRVLSLSGAGARELSAYANAHSGFQMVNAFLVFVPQLVTVYGRRGADRRVCFRFVLACGIALTLPLGLMAYSPLGHFGLSTILAVPETLLPRVREYLAWLAPLVLFVTLQQYITGRLVGAGRTRAITRFNLLHLAILVGMLETLSRTALDVRWVLASATVTANLAHVLVAGRYCLRLPKDPPDDTSPLRAPAASAAVTNADDAVGDGDDPDAAVELASAASARNEPSPVDDIRSGDYASARAPAATVTAPSPPTYTELWGFYWPMAMTSLMFAMSRPILYHYVNQLPHASAVRTVAALRVAFDSGMFFQSPVNQFRHVYAQFGAEDPGGVRRFMLGVAGVYVGIMAAFAFTPAGDLLFRHFLELDATLLVPARQSFMVMCLGPAAIAIRNVFHGELIVRHKTRGMANGGLWRILAVFLLSWGLYRLGWLNHVTGAAVMVTGFAFEALGAFTSMRKLLRKAG